MSSLVQIENLGKVFHPPASIFGKAKAHIALENVSLEIKRGETLGLIGESGSGKSTLGRCLLKLINPDSGSIFYDGTDITNIKGQPLRALRKRMQMIFQDPYSSLNPKMKIGRAVMEPLIIHGIGQNKKQREDRVAELLNLVGLPSDSFQRYPHEFSGGQRQRIGIARALAVEPELIVCDEPVSALDVSVQAQVMNLLLELQEKFKLTYLFISHDLRLVSHISHRIVVLKKGQVVEETDGPTFFSTAKHPYSKQLISSQPQIR